MPNWCENRLMIKGTEESLRLLEKEIKEASSICEAVMPTPKELLLVISAYPKKVWVDAEDNWVRVEETTSEPIPEDWTKREITDEETEMLMEKYGAADWYDWNTNFRGSKWKVLAGDVENHNLEAEWVEEGYGNHHLYLEYQTAWSPNDGVSRTILEREGISSILHSYFEAGSDFVGEGNGGKDEDGEVYYNDDCRNGITFADKLDWGYADDYEEVEVKEKLVYCEGKPFGALVEENYDSMSILPFGHAELLYLEKYEGVGMIDEWEREHWIS